MAGVTKKEKTVEFKDKKRKKGYKEKKRSKKSAQYDSGSEEEGSQKLQKLNITEKEAKEGNDAKMDDVYDGANLEKEVSSDEERLESEEEEADDEGESTKKTKEENNDTKFGNAIKQILNAPEVDKKAPILSKNKVITKILERKKAREVENKSLAIQKKLIISKYHIRPDIATNKEQETKLRKLATKGAVSVAQASQGKEKTLKLNKTIVVDGKEKQVSELEADTFVSLLKEKGANVPFISTVATNTKGKINVKTKKLIKKEVKQEKEEEFEDE